MHYFIKCLKEYATFTGRARRSEYWYFFLFNLIFSFVIGFVGGVLGTEILGLIYAFALLIPGIAVGVRRVHDTGKSGWFILVPIYNLILMLTPGDEGPNEYGPDPKSGSSAGESSEVLDDHLV